MLALVFLFCSCLLLASAQDGLLVWSELSTTNLSQFMSLPVYAAAVNCIGNLHTM